MKKNRPKVAFPTNEIAKFYQRWKVSELALFGSALRDDFNTDSDLDLLISFDADAEWSLLEHIQMQHELEALLHRPIDLLSKRALESSENWIRRGEILSSAQILFSKAGVIHAEG